MCYVYVCEEEGEKALYASNCYCIQPPVLSLLLFPSRHFLSKEYLSHDHAIDGAESNGPNDKENTDARFVPTIEIPR